MKKFGNTKTERFLKELSELPSMEGKNNDLTLRSKFNFSYFDSSQDCGQNFHDLSIKQLCDLLIKLKNYTTKPLGYWMNQRAGSGSLKILEIYGGFPKISDFTRPKHVPHQAQWGRFRLGSKFRLAGFLVPSELHKTPHVKTLELFDKNTFYIVFLDRDHRFYLTEKK